MRRVASFPRTDWRRVVESQGLLFHSPGGRPYWDERACYEFTTAEIDEIERATYELNRMCLAVVGRVVADELFDPFQIPEPFRDWVAESWYRDEFSLYGRFDLAFDGHGPPKLLEYNADTPTSLLEAAVIQWFWLKDCRPEADQFNSIHERLIEAWTSLGATPGLLSAETMYFAALADHAEDVMNVSYLRDTCAQAGWRTRHVAIENLGWEARAERFVDSEGRPVGRLFKLYPWEWMVREEFGPNLPRARTAWLEPPWKMILSNKAILPLLYEMFPDSPYLLPASFEPVRGNHVRKPLLSREGANVAIIRGGRTVLETGGDYGGPHVYQGLCELPNFDGNYPVVGSWMVNGYACGLGIREDSGPITRDTSRFVPHLFT
jgi:glutathionylspermidine synthase